MGTVTKKPRQQPAEEEVVEAVIVYARKGASTDLITWVILGGKKFMAKKPASGFDLLTAINKGITKQSVLNLAEVMAVPLKDIANMLNVSYKTLGRKRNSDVMDSLVSSLSLEIANTIAKGVSVFDEPAILNRWLQKENRALNGKRPIALFNTPTGIKMVNKVLNRIEEGIYT